MNFKRAMLAIALSLPLAGTAMAAKTEGFKYVCGNYEVVTFTDRPLVITVNSEKVDDYQYTEGESKGYPYKALDFREYAAAGGSSTKYRLVLVNGAHPVLSHQWRDADDNPKGQLTTEQCQTPMKVFEHRPSKPSMGEIRASEG